jgi:hypothetical protein
VTWCCIQKMYLQKTYIAAKATDHDLKIKSLLEAYEKSRYPRRRGHVSPL